jgi:hypothetical protein
LLSASGKDRALHLLQTIPTFQRPSTHISRCLTSSVGSDDIVPVLCTTNDRLQTSWCGSRAGGLMYVIWTKPLLLSPATGPSCELHLPFTIPVPYSNSIAEVLYRQCF